MHRTDLSAYFERKRMKIDELGLEFLKSLEGLKLKPYLDIARVWTIGYGHTLGVNANTPPITEEQAELLLEEDLIEPQDTLNRLVTTTLTQSEFNALVSFVFNEGVTKFVTSTLLIKLNQGDKQGAAKEFDRWIYFRDRKTGEIQVSKSLRKRRDTEKRLFLNDFLTVRQSLTV
jgi:lysozyme